MRKAEERMAMISQQSSSRMRAWKRSSSALNNRLCELLTDHDEEDGYLLFARPHINHPLVSAVLGAAFATQRESVDLTQEAVAEAASISVGRLRDIEKGRGQPTLSVILSLCESLGIDPRELLTEVLNELRYPVGVVPPKSCQPLVERAQPSSGTARQGGERPQG